MIILSNFCSCTSIRTMRWCYTEGCACVHIRAHAHNAPDTAAPAAVSTDVGAGICDRSVYAIDTSLVIGFHRRVRQPNAGLAIVATVVVVVQRLVVHNDLNIRRGAQALDPVHNFAGQLRTRRCAQFQHTVLGGAHVEAQVEEGRIRFSTCGHTCKASPATYHDHSDYCNPSCDL